MTGAERGFALLTSRLGDPNRRPLTTAQLRKLHRRVRDGEKTSGDRDLEPRDLMALGYGRPEAEHILTLLGQESLLQSYLDRAGDCALLTPVSPGYPLRLLEALGDDAPGCIWARGDLALLQGPAIALVGSRELNPENRRFAAWVGELAARQGITLVSGNARGADRTAQNACLQAGGSVISIVADSLLAQQPRPNLLWLSEESFDCEFSAQRALSRNRCIHALGFAAIAAQSSLKTGGTWDGSVKNLRSGWSPLYVFDDGSDAMTLLQEMGAIGIGLPEDLNRLPSAGQLHL